MRSLSLLMVTVLYTASNAFPEEGAKNHHHHFEHHKPMCLGKELQMPEGFNASRKACHEKIFGPMDQQTKPMKDREPKEFMCVMVCHAQELELIDESGKIKMDEIEELISEIYPKEAITPLTDKVKLCLKEFGTEVKTTKGDCSSVESRLNCIRKGFMEVCMPNFSPPSATEKKE